MRRAKPMSRSDQGFRAFCNVGRELKSTQGRYRVGIPDKRVRLRAGGGQRQRIILLPCAAVCSTGRSRRPKGGWMETRGAARVPPELRQYRIAMERGFLRAELLERETAEETRRFFRAVVFESARHRCSRVLVQVRSSK